MKVKRPMNAAIYARKSTEQNGVATEAKSVTRQIENAHAFAKSKGWYVDEAHVFSDDGKSGAEFERRPGLQRLIAATKPRPAFSVLIVSEQKSLGREASETGYLIKQLAQAGVEIFEYGQGQSRTPKNWMDKAMSSLRSAADEAHREDTSMRVHEAHTSKVKRGYCVGGRVFGYRNVDVCNGFDQHGRPLRSHVIRQIEPKEAATVKRIFELYASGLGLKTIAKRLTAEEHDPPRPFVRKDPTKPEPVRGWAPATIRAILKREDYRGVKVWNRSRKRDMWGQVDQRPRPESEWQRVKVPELRIVSDRLWSQVASRRKDTEGKTLRFESGRLSGRPPKKDTANLLAGLATCAECGGGLIVETSARKRGRVPEYACFRRRANGSCKNDLRIPADVLNEAVLQAIEEHALTPEAIEQVVQLTELDDQRDRATALANDRKDVEKRIARLVAAVESGSDVAPLVEKLRELEERRRAIDAEIADLKPIPRLPAKVIEDRLAEWRRLLRQSTTQGRAVLQRVLRGRIVFTRTPSGYSFNAPTRFDRLFSGIAFDLAANGKRKSFLPEGDTTGTEAITTADTGELDYGRLLERAQAKRVTSPKVSRKRVGGLLRAA